MAVMFAGRSHASGPVVVLLLAALLGTSLMADRQAYTDRGEKPSSELETKESSKLQTQVNLTANSTLRFRRASARRTANQHLQCQFTGPENSGFKLWFKAEKGCGLQTPCTQCGPCVRKVRELESEIAKFFQASSADGVCKCSVATGQSVVMEFKPDSKTICSQLGCSDKYLAWYNARTPDTEDDISTCNVQVSCHECPSTKAGRCYEALVLPTNVELQDPHKILDTVEKKPKTPSGEGGSEVTQQVPKQKLPTDPDFIEPGDKEQVVITTEDGPQSVTVSKNGDDKVVITGEREPMDEKEQLIFQTVDRIGEGTLKTKKTRPEIVDDIQKELDPSNPKPHQDIQNNPLYKGLVKGLGELIEKKKNELDKAKEIHVPIKVPDEKVTELKTTPGMRACGELEFPEQCVLMPRDLGVKSVNQETSLYVEERWKETLKRNTCRGQTMVFGLPKDGKYKTAQAQQNRGMFGNAYDYFWGTEKVNAEEAKKNAETNTYLAIVFRDTDDILDDLNNPDSLISKLKIVQDIDETTENSKIVIQAPDKERFNPVPQTLELAVLGHEKFVKENVHPYKEESSFSIQIETRDEVPTWVVSIAFKETSSNEGFVSIDTEEERPTQTWGSWATSFVHSAAPMTLTLQKFHASSAASSFKEGYLVKCEVQEKYTRPAEVQVSQHNEDEFPEDEDPYSWTFGNNIYDGLDY